MDGGSRKKKSNVRNAGQSELDLRQGAFTSPFDGLFFRPFDGSSRAFSSAATVPQEEKKEKERERKERERATRRR